MYKLVRDNIPKIMSDNSQVCNYAKIQNDEFYESFLRQKLIEEVNEFLAAEDVDKAVEEIVDVKTVLIALQKAYKVSDEDFNKLYNAKLEEKGAFDEKIIAFFPDEPVKSN